MDLWILWFYSIKNISKAHLKIFPRAKKASFHHGVFSAVDEARLVDTGLSCVAFALLIGDYMAKSVAWSIWVGQLDKQLIYLGKL